jgi:hypothetical protein
MQLKDKLADVTVRKRSRLEELCPEGLGRTFVEVGELEGR